MERKRVVAIALILGLAFWCGSDASAQDKKDGGGGPYGLPTLAEVKDKVKPTDEEAKKLDEIYATATKNEAESRARAKENGTDRKTLDGFLSISRNETINKIKEALDKDKAAAFDKILAASSPGKKKK
jgi:hypothetical protein